MAWDEYDDYADAAKKDGEAVLGRRGGIVRDAAVENLLTRSELSRGERRFEGTCSAFATLDDAPLARRMAELWPTGGEQLVRDLESCLRRVPASQTMAAAGIEDALTDLRHHFGLTDAQVELARAEVAIEQRAGVYR